jgi:hypothetical protein
MVWSCFDLSMVACNMQRRSRQRTMGVMVVQPEETVEGIQFPHRSNRRLDDMHRCSRSGTPTSDLRCRSQTMRTGTCAEIRGPGRTYVGELPEVYCIRRGGSASQAEKNAIAVLGTCSKRITHRLRTKAERAWSRVGLRRRGRSRASNRANSWCQKRALLNP